MFSRNKTALFDKSLSIFLTFHKKGFVNRMIKIAKSHKGAPFLFLSAQCQISKYSKTNFS